MKRPVSMPQAGMALLAVLVTLTVLLLLAIPFAVGMGIGNQASWHTADVATAATGSASARDLLLTEAALAGGRFDPSPDADELAEYPDALRIPAALEAVTEGGRVLPGGEVIDLQRRIDLLAATPLLFANALGTFCRTATEFVPESTTLTVDDAARLPDQGFVLVDYELVHYGRKDGNVLTELRRGQGTEFGFVLAKDHSVPDDRPVWDYRCLLAATFLFDRDNGLGPRQALQLPARVGELAAIATQGHGGFSVEEMDRLQQLFTTGSGHGTAPAWGRPERVFDGLEVKPPFVTRSLRVRSAVHMGPGSVVRLRNLRTGEQELGIVMDSGTDTGGQLAIDSNVWLRLLWPVRAQFPNIDTVVEPLLPPPVNVNTADAETIALLVTGNTRSRTVIVHDGGSNRSTAPISRREARDFADRLIALRDRAGGGEPFDSFESFARRLFAPLFEAADSPSQKNRWILLYRGLLTGRDAALEMGTAPVSFVSGPWVEYRAAASVSRSRRSLQVSARSERRGTALALLGLPMEQEWNRQDLFEEAFRLDQRAPYWLTLPVNTGAMNPSERGNDPASRFFPHVIALAYPSSDLGQPRFPSRDTADQGIALAPVSTPPRPWRGEFVNAETFSTSIDVRGRDVTQEGAYQVVNIGPSAPGAEAPKSSRHDRISFPYSDTATSFVARFGTSAWFELQQLGNQILFEHGDGDAERNRIALEIRDGNLMLEVIDEAGIDPDPSQSTTSPDRTAAVWQVPLAELGLPAGTPVHLNVSAYGTRSGEQSLLVDGFPRGKPKFLTTLTAAIPPYDHTAEVVTVPGTGRRYAVEVMVESTDGFPDEGTIRIGRELFEYVAKTGNSFLCTYNDSRGGRMARQLPVEFRPDMPTGPDGSSTQDLRQLPANVPEVTPDHAAGSAVELYGYSTPLAADTPLMIGETNLSEALGPFAIARVWFNNARPVVIALPNGGSFRVGDGLDLNFSGEMEIYDPVPPPDGRHQGQPQPRTDVVEAFATSGGYALLVQSSLNFNFDPNNTGATTGSTMVGGIEVIRYASRNGNRLSGIQRNVQLPGDNGLINADLYDGTARQFIVDWNDVLTLQRQPGQNRPTTYDMVPQLQCFLVPISLSVQSGECLADPSVTRYSEWLQLYPRDNETDTEWVRYDALLERRFPLRSSRNAWGRAYGVLINGTGRQTVNVGPLGSQNSPTNDGLDPQAIWGTIPATSGYIGYVPQLESDLPQIHRVRQALGFRGDPFTRTSSHRHANSTVQPVHRLSVSWGNYGALTGRCGRQDRVALVAGSTATGANRPDVTWQTVNWTALRLGVDDPSTQGERLGPDPFQLAAFKGPVTRVYLGRPRNQQVIDVRSLDRVVKFPSGELPAAYCADVPYGSGTGNRSPMQGIVDEVYVCQQLPDDALLDEACNERATELLLHPGLRMAAHGPLAGNPATQLPAQGGLVQIDEEIIAFREIAGQRLLVAQNGRGMLGTEPRAHDESARVRFLAHVPAAILSDALNPQGHEIAIQAPGAMPLGRAAALVGREVVHYAWAVVSGDRVTLAMPRWFPPDGQAEASAARGLFRGRFGTTPESASAGQAIVWLPIRHWDRHVDRSDDPEQGLFQMTSQQAPVFWKHFDWRQETTDATVDVACYLRLDGKAPWTSDPDATPGFRRLQRSGGNDRPFPLGWYGSQLEARFVVVYRSGCFDPVTHLAHGYKTTPKVKDVRVEYEGQGVILSERVDDR